jgi:hypothetical protein
MVVTLDKKKIPRIKVVEWKNMCLSLIALPTYGYIYVRWL